MNRPALAASNGMLTDGALVAGRVIVIPNKVTNIHNNSQTWRPYSAGDAIGRVDPMLVLPQAIDFEHISQSELAQSQKDYPGLSPLLWLQRHPDGNWASAPAYVQYEHYMDVTRGSYGAAGQMSMAGLDMGTNGGIFNLAAGLWARVPLPTRAPPPPPPYELRLTPPPPPPPSSPYDLGVASLGDSANSGAYSASAWATSRQLTSNYSFSPSLALQLAGLGTDVGNEFLEGRNLEWRNSALNILSESPLPPADNATASELMVYQMRLAGIDGRMLDTASRSPLPGPTYPDGSGWGYAAPWEKPGQINWTTFGQRQYILGGGLMISNNVLPLVETIGTSIGTLARQAAPVVRDMDAPISLTRIELAAPFSLDLGLFPDFSLPGVLPTVEMAVQESNDAKAIQGKLNVFGEAWDAAWERSWSLMLAHLKYEPSPEARAAIYLRLNPDPDPRFARIDAIRRSGWAGVTTIIGHLAGASNDVLDQLAQGAELAEGTIGQFGGFQPPRFSRSNTPASGRRVRNNWQVENARLRAEQTVANADLPLENPLPSASRSGHGHGDHGHQTTFDQQSERVRTGITPTGRLAPSVNKASKFTSPEAEAEALGRGSAELLSALKNGAVPTGVVDGNGLPTFVLPNGTPVRQPIVVSTNRVGGFGQSVIKVKDPLTNATVYDAAGLPVTMISPGSLSSVKIIWEYVPSVGGWRPVTYYPQ